jgi:hypothetical protein
LALKPRILHPHKQQTCKTILKKEKEEGKNLFGKNLFTTFYKLKSLGTVMITWEAGAGGISILIFNIS